jgi:DNA primase
MQGTTKIYILFDGDTAGREAASKLKPILEELEFVVEIVPVEEGTDPGDFSQEDVNMLKEYING